MHAIQADCNKKKWENIHFHFLSLIFMCHNKLWVSEHTVVYKKSGIQKDILAIQCQMLNLCNDTKPSNHLSSQ